MFVPVRLSQGGEGVLANRDLLVVQAEVPIGPPEDVQHSRAHLRLLFQRRVDPFGAEIEKGAHPHGVPVARHRVGRLEQIDQQRRYLLGRLGFLRDRPRLRRGRDRVAHRERGQGHDRHGKRRRDGDRDFVAPDEARGAVAQRVLAGADRQARLIAANVLREMRDRCVAPARLFPERHQDDRVEIAGQLTAQTLHGGAACPRHSGGRYRTAGVVIARPFRCTQQAGAGSSGFFAADRALSFGG